VPHPDPNACLCCGKWALGGYVEAELGKVCDQCVHELADDAGLLEDD